ncbi:hypothetical protein GCM10023075_53190 [Streptosporangium album]
MTGPPLLGLHDGLGIGAGPRQMGVDPLSFVTYDNNEPLGSETSSGGEHVVDQGTAAQLMQDFRCFRLHPGALACGKDDDGGRARHTHGRGSLGIAAET